MGFFEMCAIVVGGWGRMSRQLDSFWESFPPLFPSPPPLATPETGGDGRRSIAFFLKMQIFFEYFSSPSSPPGEKEEGGGYRSKSPW